MWSTDSIVANSTEPVVSLVHSPYFTPATTDSICPFDVFGCAHADEASRPDQAKRSSGRLTYVRRTPLVTRTMSSRIRYRHGTRTRMIPVAKRIPNPNEIAIGMMYCACNESSKINGMRPPNVVKVVSKIGRKRRNPACDIASNAEYWPR